ncbi:MAG: hypothetical protein CSB13_00215 [Chloroflexi bacterium]|nr:MAG: hypothetical protein CSB13_00215 [Chloroflexota bacterium]
MDLQAITGQLHIVNGEIQQTTGDSSSTSMVPGLLAQSAPSKANRSRKNDFLFIHLTLTGTLDDMGELSQDILTTTSQQYYQAGGSITSALRKAISAANRKLLHLNLSTTARSREGALSCAVLHNDELFLVQTGEALALLGHNYGVERLPPTPPQKVTPLGRSAGLNLHYDHYRLQDGDILLLADPRITHLPTEVLAPALVDVELETGLSTLKHIVGANTARLLLIEFTKDAEERFPDMMVMAPTTAVTTTDDMPDPVREGTPPVIPAASRQPQPVQSDSTSKPSSDLAANVEYNTRKATAGAALGLAHFTDWLTDMLARLKPPRHDDEDEANWTLPAILALAIPLLVAMIVTGVYLQHGDAQRFAEIKTEMGQNIGIANTVEGEQQRTYYQHVLTLAEEAEAIRPLDDEVARLRQQAKAALDELDGVTRLQGHLLYEYEPKTLLTAVTLQGGFDGGLYTLDNDSNVTYHQTDESYTQFEGVPENIVFRDKALGSHIVRNVIDMMWRPQGNHVSRDGIAMLDTGGTLITYYPNHNDTRAAPLGLASGWQIPQAITTFDERLYILDVGAREIWKYYPEDDGFIIKDDAQILALDAAANLESAIDIDIYSEDGSLLILYSNGQIRYYDTRSGRVQWDEQKLMTDGGLTLPLARPTAAKLVGKGLNSSVFVADPGTGRILQIARGGLVIAQYRADDEVGRDLFHNIQDFAVAEAPLRIFVTDGNKLYVVTES